MHDLAPAVDDLVPLPDQPADVPWPSTSWPRGDLPSGSAVADLVDAMFTDTKRYGSTYAVVVVQRGRLVLERYGGALPKWDGPDEPVTPATRLLSWSVAKSVLHAVVGILVGRKQLNLDAPAPVAEWQAPDDPRRAITLDHLLAMRDGLAFREEYVVDAGSDVVEMLFGSGAADVAAFAAARPLAHPPGDRYNYSSGTSNIVSRIVAGAIGGGAASYERFLRDELFEPIGMTTATPRFDEAGTWIGSSYLYATAQDFARFGLLVLRDGCFGGRRILPEGWVDHGRRARSVDPADGRLYGAHWWVTGDEHGGFWANGYEGQSILVIPALDAVVCRFGRTPAEGSAALLAWRAEMTAALA